MGFQSDINDGWKFGPQTIILGLFLLALLTFGGFQINKVLLPAREDLRREVFEHSKSYIDGTIRDLDNLHVQWMTAENDTQRNGIAAIALHRSVDFSEDELPKRLVEWLDSIR